MRIALFGKVVSEENAPYIKQIFTELEKHHIQYHIYEPFLQKMKEIY